MDFRPSTQLLLAAPVPAATPRVLA